MNKWIKPSELPEGFWGECFVAICNEGEIFVEINHVKVTPNGAYWYLDDHHCDPEWLSFNSDQSCVRLMTVEYPKPSLEDFKC
jgi:hypothetical protein